MDAPLDGLSSLSSVHFALIYIDENGKLRFEASPSIASNCQSILSPNVTDSFLRAVALSNKGDPGVIGKPSCTFYSGVRVDQTIQDLRD